MSEAAPEGGNTSGETPAADEFKPITSQDDLNRIIGERVKRATSKYADYQDVAAKAAEFDKLQAANQTEAEKAAGRIAELEAELTGVRSETTRLRIASEHGITDADDIALFLTGTDEETLTKQAKRLADRDADRKKAHVVSGEGKTPNAASGEADRRAFVRQLTGRE